MIKLGDVATYINGYAFKPEDRGEVGLPIIRIQDLTGNAYDLGFYNGDYPKRIEINDGDVLISWSASLGVYVWNRGRALLNQHIFKVEFDKVNIDKSYFVYAVRQKLAEMAMKTHGATMKHIVKKDFEETLIPYPSQKKQIEIGTNLDKIANIIAARKQQLELLDELVKARFVEMFGDVSIGDYRYETRKLGDVANIGSSHRVFTTEFVESGIPFYRGKEIAELAKGTKPTNLYYISVEHYNRLTNDDTKPQIGDLLMPSICNKGQVWMVDTTEPFYYKDGRVLCISPDRNIFNTKYLEYFMKAKTLVEYPKLGSGSTFAEFKIFLLKDIDILIPPRNIQDEFADFVHQIDKSKVAIQKSLDETQILFDSLMQKYFG